MEIIEKIILWFKGKNKVHKSKSKAKVKEANPESLDKLFDSSNKLLLEMSKERFDNQCSVCNKKLDIYSHKCPYCKKWHCYEHLLPETHKCSNPKNPYIGFK